MLRMFNREHLGVADVGGISVLSMRPDYQKQILGLCPGTLNATAHEWGSTHILGITTHDLENWGDSASLKT